MNNSDRYLKIVEWSEEDDCYLDSALGLIEHCCHGDDEQEVFKELGVIVDEWIEILQAQQTELPPPTFNQGMKSRFIEGVRHWKVLA